MKPRSGTNRDGADMSAPLQGDVIA